jgi:hypothetical protein
VLTVGTVAATVLTGGLTASASAAAPPEGPAGDAFYQPPSPLPSGAPGDVIRYRKLADFNNSDAYLILYRSTNATNQPVAVSGTILVPKGGNPATMPIIGLAPGSLGLGDACAPSKNTSSIASQFGNALDRGWAVAITDYEGLGTPGQHTYVVGRSEGPALIDVVRAATRLPQAGLSPTAKVAFLGYSQGGGAAAWAAELQPRYAPELNLVGLAAGGVPADIPALAGQLDGGVGFGVLAMALIGFDAAYPELNLDSYLNADGRETFAKYRDSCVSDFLLNLPFRHLSDFTTSNPFNNTAWKARFAENKLGSTAPRTPAHLYHALLTDELVAYGQAATLRRTYCNAGVSVQWLTYPGDHVTTMITGEPAAVEFLADRFAGRSAPNNCWLP